MRAIGSLGVEDRASEHPPARLLRGALDAMLAHVAILDADATILAVNEAWLEFGRQNDLEWPDGAVGRNYLEVCEVGAAAADASSVQACERVRELVEGSKSSVTFEYPCHSPDKLRWFIFRGARFEEDGETRFVVSHDDITNRRLSEEALRVSHDALESFNRVVAHDMRAPFRRIEDLCRIAAEGAAPKEMAYILSRIEREAHRARDLANDLLALSRVSELAIDAKPVDLSAIAREIVGTLHTSEPGRNVTVNVAPDLTDVADPGLARIVLWNLIENAWKFTRTRTEGIIEVGRTLDTPGPPEYFVRDNGIGFRPTETSRLFEPFTRLDATPTFEGTGVGLTIVRRAVERHGGRAWATGEPDHGATFWFTLAPA